MKTSLLIRQLPARIRGAIHAFRNPVATIPKTPGGSILIRELDSNAANLLAAHAKVQQMLSGQIPLPEVVELFITNYCNFACPFCRCAKYHGDNTEFLNIGTMEKLLKDLSEQGIRTIELGGGGEPLMHPQIAEIFQAFRQYAFRVGLITNGYQLTEHPELIGQFAEIGDWVRFSLDGISTRSFRVVHGRQDISYEPLREAIVEAVRITNEKAGIDRRPKIGIKLIIQKPNQEEVIDAVDEAEALGVHFLQYKFLEGHPFTLGEERYILLDKLQKRAKQVDPKRLYIDVLPGYGGEIKEQKKCRMAVLHPLIDWDGTIYLCAFFHHRKDRHSIGSLNDGGFFDHWGSERHREAIRLANPKECVPNCPMLRYDPIIDFIETDAFRFPYI